MLHYRCHDMSRSEDPLLVLKLLDGYEKFLWQWPSFMRSTALLVISAFFPNLNNLCICNICNSGMLKCTKLYVCKILWGSLHGSHYIYIHSTSMFYHVLQICVLFKCQEALASLCMSYLYKCGLLHFDLAWSYVVDFGLTNFGSLKIWMHLIWKTFRMMDGSLICFICHMLHTIWVIFFLCTFLHLAVLLLTMNWLSYLENPKPTMKFIREMWYSVHRPLEAYFGITLEGRNNDVISPEFASLLNI
jgi:hypothetical protein